jgi:serine O-acetyltransferase
MFGRLRGDFNRHERKLGNMGVWVLAVYRYGRWAKELPQPLRFAADRVYHALDLGIQIATGCVIPREVEIGEAPHLVHHFDIRIHPGVKIGDRVGIMHEVTIATTMHRLGAPTIGNDVFIGAGAKIIGPVKIGDGAVIAPNSLVIADVPAGATAMGVPAKARKIQLETKSEWPSKPGQKAS